MKISSNNVSTRSISPGIGGCLRRPQSHSQSHLEDFHSVNVLGDNRDIGNEIMEGNDEVMKLRGELAITRKLLELSKTNDTFNNNVVLDPCLDEARTDKAQHQDALNKEIEESFNNSEAVQKDNEELVYDKRSRTFVTKQEFYFQLNDKIDQMLDMMNSKENHSRSSHSVSPGPSASPFDLHSPSMFDHTLPSQVDPYYDPSLPLLMNQAQLTKAPSMYTPFPGPVYTNQNQFYLPQ